MAVTSIASKKSKRPRISLDRSIERMRKHLADLAPYVKKGKASRSLEEFDAESERLIAESLGKPLPCWMPISMPNWVKQQVW